MSDEGKINDLEEKLYSRTRYKVPSDARSPVSGKEPTSSESNWNTPALDDILKHERISPSMNPFMKKVFISSLVFFVLALIIAGLVFTGGLNFVSSKNVDINVLGPSMVSAGEPLDLGISISNENNADLEVSSLSIQYPPGARSPEDSADVLTYERIDLGEIGAGAEAVHNTRLVLLGSVGEVKEVKFSVEYTVKGSNATFHKDKIFEVTIGDAPISIEVDSPTSIVSGENFTTKVTISLNSEEILKNVVMKAEYPYGFTPTAETDNNIWILGDLSPGDKRTISVTGRLVGENEEERTFRFYVGVSDSGSIDPSPKVVIASLLNTVAINRPSVGLSMTFNGESSSPYLAPAARNVSMNIRFQNNLPDKLLNPRLEATISGPAIDVSSIRVGENGMYDHGTSKISWNLINNSGVSELLPGESGRVSISFSSLPASVLSQGINDITLTLSLSGIPVGTLSTPVTVREVGVVRISSQVSLSSKVLRSLGSFVNYGPIPPKVGNDTSYTIVFNVVNTQNNLTGVKVTAKLAKNVGGFAMAGFTTENVTHDSLTGDITWDIGDLPSGTGFSSSAKELSFQVVLTPLANQVGTAPALIQNIVLTGRDTVTGDTVTVPNAPLTTRLSSDPSFIQGDDIVVK